MRIVRKISITLILLVGVLFTFQSCQKESENEPIYPIQQENNLLGKKLENPYSVKNMQIALDNLLGKNKESNDIILPTHLYIKFIPIDEAELDRLDSLKYISEYPLDYEVIEGESSYRDPEVSEDQPTFQYTSIKIGEEIPNVNYEVLEELYIPEEDPNYIGKGKISVEDLVNEALKITNNLDGNEITHSKWRPSGTLRVWDDIGSRDDNGNFLGNLIPLRGVKVEARRWFTVHTGITDDNGYYSCDGTFSRPANYKIVWERAYYDIRDGLWGQAIYNGPKQDSSWSLDIGSSSDTNKSMRYAHIHRAAYRYIYDYCFGLERPIFYGVKLKISYYHREQNDGINGDFNSVFGGGLFSHVRIFGKNSSGWRHSPDLFSTTSHELTHVSHYVLIGNINFWRTTSIITESWARACQIELTNYEYRNYLKNNGTAGTLLFYNIVQQYFDYSWKLPCVGCSSEDSDQRESYTPLFYDLVDVVNQKQHNPNAPNDIISTYTLSELQNNVLKYNTFGLSSLKQNLFDYNHPGVSIDDIGNYMSYYFNNI